MIDLEQKARWVRQQVLEMCMKAGEGRVASSLSCVEILLALYHGGILRFDPKNPKWDGRDRFILSKGQGTPALYCVLADLGFFPKEELDRFCQPGAMLGPYGETTISGVEAVWGSLGHGLGVAAGLALAARMDNKLQMVVVLMSDGECYEGSVWEAAMFAGHHGLNNLAAVVDRNYLCVTGFTEDCLRLEPLDDKFGAFGWDVVSIDGHSFEGIFSAFKAFRSRRSSRPLAVIAETVKGKGVSLLENNPLGHVIIPSRDEIDKEGTMNDVCQPLPQTLSPQEKQLFEKCLHEWKDTGKCPHMVARLYAEGSGPYHGCIVCGKPVA